MSSKCCVAPVSGEVISLETVKDPVFASKTLGDGIAIRPSENTVCAPMDGTLKLMFHTGHAFVIEGDAGDEIMVHIGIDTVNYQGKGFEKRVSEGSRVKTGEVLVTFSRNYLDTADMTTMIIRMGNSEEKLKKSSGGFCNSGKDKVLEW